LCVIHFFALCVFLYSIHLLTPPCSTHLRAERSRQNRIL
jgi:hypothetical protein